MKTALITGGASGIGKQIGIDLLKLGCFVIFVDKNKESLSKLNKSLSNKYKNFISIKTDMSNQIEVNQLAEYIKKLDIFISNAGITDRTSFGIIKMSNWNNVFNINLNMPFFLIQELQNKINRNGKIIFISSISGIIPDSVSISYGVSKAAINMLVPYLAKEFAYKKITVNAIAPGYISTPWHIGKTKAQINRITSKCLANRLGKTKEISKIVLSVINNDFINGQIIRVDGGWIG